MEDVTQFNWQLDLEMQKKYQITLEKHLEILSNKYPSYKELYSSWITAKRLLTNILQSISIIFPHYSMHDASHSNTIIRNIERILGTERIKKLEPSETWLILMSAYAHDIGMLVKNNELQETWKSKEFEAFLNSIKCDESDEVLQKYVKEYIDNDNFNWKDSPKLNWGIIILSAEYFRRKHAENSEKYICKSITEEKNDFKIDFSFNGIIPDRIIKLLGKIVMLHGKEFKDIFELDYQANGIIGDNVHPRCVAVFLRLGDLLDLDNGRFNENTKCLYGEFPDKSILNEEKHKAITHLLVTENNIAVTADCKDEETYNLVNEWFNWLNDEVKNLALNWNKIMPNNFGSALSLPECKIFLEGEKLKNDALMRFNFSNNDIFELLEGANIYESKFTFFRELIQNAIDASKIRLWLLVKDGTYDLELNNPSDINDEIYEYFKIVVDIVYDEEKDIYIISIRDRGIGLNERTLENMTHVAKSWESRIEWKKLIREMPAWLRPTGGFGLGLQSVFKMTNCMECITKPYDECAKKITFRSRSHGGRISYRKYLDNENKLKTGSVFTFNISADKCKVTRFNLFGYFYKQLEKYDPFVNSNIPTDVYHMLENIFNEVGAGLFPIEVKASIKQKSKASAQINFFTEKINRLDYSSSININKSSCIDNRWYVFSSFSKLGNEYKIPYIEIYDKDKCVAVKILIKNNNHRTKCLFKGMPLNKFNLDFSYIDRYVELEIYIDGLNTKEYLTINRAAFRTEKKEEVAIIINKILEKGIGKFICDLKENIDELSNCSGRVWFNIACLYRKFLKDKDGEIENRILNKLEQVGEKVDAFVRNDSNNKFEKQEIQMSDLLKGIWNKTETYYFLYGEKYHENLPERKIKWDEFINKENIDGKVKKIIVYENFFDIIGEKNFGNNFYKLRSKNYLINNNTDQSIHKYYSDINEEAKEYIFKDILMKPRAIILGIDEYKKIIFNIANIKSEEDKEVVGNLLTAMHFYQSMSFNKGGFIISPFIEEDLKKIKEKSTNNLMNNIFQRSDFENLMKWIQKYSIENDVSIDEIKQTYENLIKYVIEINAKTNI